MKPVIVKTKLSWDETQIRLPDSDAICFICYKLCSIASNRGSFYNIHGNRKGDQSCDAMHICAPCISDIHDTSNLLIITCDNIEFESWGNNKIEYDKYSDFQ